MLAAGAALAKIQTKICFSNAVFVAEAQPINCKGMGKPALGKGLSALITTRPPAIRIEAEAGEKIREVSLASIVPSPLQPRKEFDRGALTELVDSIRQHGIIQPLVVRDVAGRHELIAGE